jgi:hypothetical protein
MKESKLTKGVLNQLINEGWKPLEMMANGYYILGKGANRVIYDQKEDRIKRTYSMLGGWYDDR